MWHWLDPLWGAGYQFWSGIGSDFGELALFGMAWAVFRRHNCHVQGCPRIIWKEHDGHMLCRKHHPDTPPTAEEIK